MSFVGVYTGQNLKKNIISVGGGTITPKGKQCQEEVKIEENDLKEILKKDELPGDNDLIRKWAECYFKDDIKDDNSLSISKDTIKDMRGLLTEILEGRSALADLIGKEMWEKCKDTKKDTKPETAIALINCTKKCLLEVLKKDE